MAVYNDKEVSTKISKSLTGIMEAWFLTLKQVKRYSPHTIRAYMTDVKGFLRFMSDHLGKTMTEVLLARIEVRDFRSWLAARSIDMHKAASNARALSAIKSFFNFLYRQYGIKNSSLMTVEVQKLDKPLPKALTVEKTLELIRGIDMPLRNAWIGLRNRAVLMLLYGSGLRISEALNVTVDKLKLGEVGELIIVGKGNKEASVPLLPIVQEAIKIYVQSCPYDLTEGYLFRGLRGTQLQPAVFCRELKVLVQAMGLPNSTTPHSLRHSFATHLLGRCGDIRVVQELLRHKSVSTTQRYTKVEPSALVSSYKQFHPKGKKN